MKNTKAIIIEDEIHDLRILRTFLQEIGGIDIIAEVSEEENILTEILIKKPDIVFYDINLNGKPALIPLKALNNTNIHTQIIFTTAYEQYAVEVFEYSKFPYLLKPLDKDKLKNILIKIKQNKASDIKPTSFENIDLLDKIELKSQDRITYVAP